MYEGIGLGTLRLWFFARARSGDSLSAFPLELWFCAFFTVSTWVSRTICWAKMDSNVYISDCKLAIFVLEESSSSFCDSGWVWLGASVVSKDFFDSLCNCARRTPQYGTLSRLSIDSVLTAFGVRLTFIATHESFQVAASTPFKLYDHQGEVLFEDPMLLIVSQSPFDWRLFDLCRLFVYNAGCSLACAAACSFVNDVAWYPNISSRAVGCLLQCACILYLTDCGNPLTKIPFREFLS